VIGDELTPEMVAMAELMLRDLPPNEVLTTSAIRPLINCLFVEYDRRGRVEKAAAALVERWDGGDFSFVAAGLLTALSDALNGDKT
jgi:hypothetical protein